ncbi:uncharacterized protein I303_105096 [Kwoniella dejecticola CBS 10117]|uniref:NAD(P)-binding domain-containing protein n=1 Tax=Kwoniella dejecticola CBS 10117 TaxID=1296121 RepID=A0A1A6A3G5_9TREE|nr:uncharacterized protein I303_05459 [Kwoniella dejecticola CBS 10117]OBR84600.1 hypothetical protein I303_05459 [Kwoniella dejecticola CBS 10117]
MLAVFLGASKGIGYFTLLNLLQTTSDWSAVLLLRKPDCFDKNDSIRPFVENGRIQIIKGDATNEGDVKKLFQVGQVDLVVSTIGASPSIGLTGIKIDQPDLCTRGSVAMLHVLQELTYQPRVIVTSSMGIGEAHKDMPLTMRLLYSWLLDKPHQDKMSLEYLFHRSSKTLANLTSSHDTPPETLLSRTAIESTTPDFLNEVIIVRPAMMPTEEPFDALKTPSKGYRVEEGLRCYTILRSDVGRFISEQCLPGQNEWVNKCPVIGY